MGAISNLPSLLETNEVAAILRLNHRPSGRWPGAGTPRPVPYTHLTLPTNRGV